MSKDTPEDYKSNGEHTWEPVYLNCVNPNTMFDTVQRLRVPGGWLYRSITTHEKHGTHVTTTFVPLSVN